MVSPHYDIIESDNDLTAHWLVVNAVLNAENIIDTDAGQEWLSYMSPKVSINFELYINELKVLQTISVFKELY